MRKRNILLFGISNVGKTTVGIHLAQRLGYAVFDLDDEVKKYYMTTLEAFVNSDIRHAREKKRGQVIREIISKPEDKVFAISPIYYAANFNKYVLRPDVLAIELQDSPENIFQRLVFNDENDVIYKDDEYKNQHITHYLSDIKKDITFYKRSFSKITNKFDMNNDPVELVVDRIIKVYQLADRANMSESVIIKNLKRT